MPRPTAVPVRVRPTPNPDSLKFEIDGPPLAPPGGLLAVSRPSEAAGDPLAEALVALDGVATLLVVPAFVTVTKRADASWDALLPAVERVLAAHVDGPRG